MNHLPRDLMRILPITLLLITLHLFNHPASTQDAVTPLLFSWNSTSTQLAISFSDGHAEIQDLSGNVLHTLSGGHTRAVYDIAWSPDDKWIATGSSDAIINIWDAEFGTLEETINNLSGSDIAVLSWTPDSRYLLIGQLSGYPNFYVWDNDPGVRSIIYSETTTTFADISYNQNDTLFALAAMWGVIELRDSATYEVMKVLDQEAVFDGPSLVEGKIETIQWSPDGRYIASGTADLEVFLWDVQSADPVQLFRLSGSDGDPTINHQRIIDLWFNEDSTTVSSISTDGTLRTWSTATGALLADSQLAGSPFSTVIISPDHTKLAYIGAAGTLNITDVPSTDITISAQEWANLPFSPGFVAWSPDGTMIAVGSTEGTCNPDNPIPTSASIFDASTGAIVHTFTAESCSIRDLAWSPDSTQLAVGSGDSVGVRIWDAQSGELLAQNQRGLQDGVLSLTWSPDGIMIGYTGIGNTGVFINSINGETIGIFGGATSLDWNPDGSQFVSASAYTGTLFLSDTADPEAILSHVENYPNVGGVTWSPDGSKIAATTSDDSTEYHIMIWDTGFTPLVEIGGYEAPLVHKMWSSDGSRLWTGSRDNTIRVWDTTTGQALGEYQHSDILFDFDLSPDEQRIVFTDPKNQSIQFLDVTTNEDGTVTIALPEWDTLSTSPGIVKWSPDGTMIAVSSDTSPCDEEHPENFSTSIYEVASGKIIHTLTDNWCRANQLAWSPDSTRLAIGSNDTIGLRVWDVQLAQLITYWKEGPPYGTSSLSWSPDGTQLAFATPNSSTLLMDPTTGEVTVAFLGGTTLDWSPDGNKIVASSNYVGSAYIFSVVDQEQLLRIEGLHITGGLIWSSDGTTIAAVTSEDWVQHQVTLWDAETFEPIITIDGHDRPIIGLMLFLDDHRLWTAAQDNIIRVWDTTTGQALGEYQHSDILFDFDLSPDGQRIVFTDSKNQSIQFLDVTTNDDGTVTIGDAAVSQSPPLQPTSIAWSPDGTMIAISKRDEEACSSDPEPERDYLSILDANTLEVISLVNTQYSGVTDFSWSPDNTQIAFISNGPHGGIRVWDITTQQIVPYIYIPNSAASQTSIGWSPDGTQIAFGDLSGRVATIDTANGQLSTRLHVTGSYVDWNHDGTQLAAESGNLISIFDMATRKEITTLDFNMGVITNIDWSDDGAFIATYSPVHFDHTLRIIDVRTLENTQTITLENLLYDMTLSPDGSMIAGTSPSAATENLMVWDTQTGDVLNSIDQPGIFAVGWSPDGTQLTYAGKFPEGIRSIDFPTGSQDTP